MSVGLTQAPLPKVERERESERDARTTGERVDTTEEKEEEKRKRNVAS